MPKIEFSRIDKLMQALNGIDEKTIVTCKYPLHGNRNILKKHTGTIVNVGEGKQGMFITLDEGQEEYRTLSIDKILDFSIAKSKS